MATNHDIRAKLMRASELSDAGEIPGALRLLKEARELATSLRNREFLSEVENAYANHHRRSSDTAIVLRHRRRALALLGPSGHPLKLAIARSNLAGTLMSIGEYTEALKLLYRALDHFTRSHADDVCATTSSDDAPYLVPVLYSLANLYISIQDFVSAMTYLKLHDKVISTFKLPQHPDAFGLLVICHYEIGDHAEAERYAELQLIAARTQGDHKAEAMAYSGLAMTSLKQGKLHEAREFNRKALDKSTEIRDRIRRVEALCNQAEIECQFKQFNTALIYLGDVLRQAPYLLMPALIERIHLCHTTVFEGLNEYRQALVHFKLAIAVRDRVNITSQQHEVVRIRQTRMKRAVAVERKLLLNKLKAQRDSLAHSTDVSNQLLQLAPSLSRIELKVCALLALGASTKEIAETMSASRHTIDGHRTAIRKKLGIPSTANLSTWLMGASIPQK